MANQNSAGLNAHRFIASVNNGHFVLQPPLNYQVVAQNIRAADVLNQHHVVNPQPLEPQERGLPHVVDVSTARRRHNAQRRQALHRALESNQATAERRRNDARRVAARRADNLPFHNFARRDIMPELNICEHCHALKFEDEKSFKCCHEGKVSLPNLEPYPQELSDLMFEDTAQGKNCRANIRQFNSVFSFASFGANIAPPPGRGPPCFRLCGQIVHRSGTLHPEHGFPPSYSQLYIYDGENALNQRMNRPENRNCHPDVMRTIQNVMHRDNPYALAFKHMSEVEQEEHLIAAAENRLPSEVQMYMKVAGDRRTYNLPHHDEPLFLLVKTVHLQLAGTLWFIREIVIWKPFQRHPLIWIQCATPSSFQEVMVVGILAFHMSENVLLHGEIIAQCCNIIHFAVQFAKILTLYFTAKSFFNNMLLMLIAKWKGSD